MRISKVWNMALLKVNGNENDKFDFVKLPDVEDEVFCGEEVSTIENPDALRRSFMSDWLTYVVSFILVL